ncbi:LAFE_0G00298g1_1 [Lachancea fermentati]|uniref:LAFE_0G00298g1_1 n=1 Tax=Lachancea fermentati TaxID=4955 RepID=A0A1G4MGG7_LACFM|nr:LAFE_0G00298g1_1 [Lachancea fermentati]
MSESSENKFTTPTFKVSLARRGNGKVRKLKTCSIEKDLRGSFSSLIFKNEGINIYMTQIVPKSIPELPREIAEQLHTLGKDEFKGARKDRCNKRNLKEDKNTKKRNRRINPFIAFRSYYSKFANGNITQQKLSVLLSKFWAAKKDVQEVWDCLAQHYNVECTNLSFSEWLEQTYQSKSVPELRLSHKDSHIKKPFIEDLYLRDMNFIALQSFTGNKRDWIEPNFNDLSLEYSFPGFIT